MWRPAGDPVEVLRLLIDQDRHIQSTPVILESGLQSSPGYVDYLPSVSKWHAALPQNDAVHRLLPVVNWRIEQDLPVMHAYQQPV